jgi:hypothetical protein
VPYAGLRCSRRLLHIRHQWEYIEAVRQRLPGPEARALLRELSSLYGADSCGLPATNASGAGSARDHLAVDGPGCPLPEPSFAAFRAAVVQMAGPRLQLRSQLQNASGHHVLSWSVHALGDAEGLRLVQALQAWGPQGYGFP